MNLQKINIHLAFFTLSLSIAVGTFFLLDWPLMAKIPLSICIVIESFYLMQLFYKNYWANASLSFDEFVSKITEKFYNTDLG